MQANQQEWKDFYASILKRTGLDLDLYRAAQLQRRILSLGDHKGFKNLKDFYGWIGADQQNTDYFCDHLAINVSELFRNADKWVEMENKIIPGLLKRSPQLKIWSAGCSYGAEAHTLAMILKEKFPGNHKIIGSDIDMAALNQAKRGEFSDSDVKGIPPQYKKYVEKQEKNWLASNSIKSYLSFNKQNLLADRFDKNFDLIMCRNVVIYFTDEAKAELYKKFYQSLKPGGILFVGSTERIFQAEEIGFTTALPFYYQKPIAEDNKWRNAS